MWVATATLPWYWRPLADSLDQLLRLLLAFQKRRCWSSIAFGVRSYMYLTDVPSSQALGADIKESLRIIADILALVSQHSISALATMDWIDHPVDEGDELGDADA